MSLTNVSLKQFLDVWVELEKALHGENSFGGDTAEIYAYRLMPHSPSFAHANPTGMVLETKQEIQREAAEALAAIAKEFEQRYSVEILIDEETVDDWVEFHAESFGHRCLVQVLSHRDDVESGEVLCAHRIPDSPSLEAVQSLADLADDVVQDNLWKTILIDRDLYTQALLAGARSVEDLDITDLQRMVLVQTYQAAELRDKLLEERMKANHPILILKTETDAP